MINKILEFGYAICFVIFRRMNFKKIHSPWLPFENGLRGQLAGIVVPQERAVVAITLQPCPNERCVWTCDYNL